MPSSLSKPTQMCHFEYARHSFEQMWQLAQWRWCLRQGKTQNISTISKYHNVEIESSGFLSLIQIGIKSRQSGATSRWQHLWPWQVDRVHRCQRNLKAAAAELQSRLEGEVMDQVGPVGWPDPEQKATTVVFVNVCDLWPCCCRENFKGKTWQTLFVCKTLDCEVPQPLRWEVPSPISLVLYLQRPACGAIKYVS